MHEMTPNFMLNRAGLPGREGRQSPEVTSEAGVKSRAETPPTSASKIPSTTALAARRQKLWTTAECQSEQLRRAPPSDPSR